MRAFAWSLGLAVVGVLITAALWAVGVIDLGGRKGTEAEIATGQADAALESGADAANTSADNEVADAKTDKDVENAQREIDAAMGRGDPAASGRAARGGLCDVDPDYCK